MVLNLISKEDIEKIHLATINILYKVGVKFNDEEALRVFDENGAEVDYKGKIVKINESLIKEAIMKCPKTIKLYSRNQRNFFEVGNGKTYTHTPEGAHLVEDLETGVVRPALLEDMENFIKLINNLDNINVYAPIVDPQDIPLKVRDLYRSKISLENLEKHFIICSHSYEGMVHSVKMASIIVGGIDELVKRPIVTGDGGAVSPLTSSNHNLKILKYCASIGLPCSIGSMPQAGATAPASLAGTIVLQNAENLSWITLAQLIKPKLPVISLTRASIMDLRNGRLAAGAPEAVIMSAILTQLYKHYEIPVDSGWCVSDSILLDVQVGYDKMPMMLISILSNADFISGFGLIGSGSIASYLQLVIDDEAFSIVSRIARGVEINDESLALDIIGKVGPEGSFLGEKHTIKTIKMGEYFFPKVFSRIGKEGESITCRARRKVMELLSKSQPEPLPIDVRKELNTYFNEALKQVT
ncbi:MAG: trimethylamine methyltransferase family protein [Candidatus Methanomethylicia archaeon]